LNPRRTGRIITVLEDRMMDKKILLIATAIGAALQVAMVVFGHMIPGLRDPGFAIGGMGISAVAGVLFARKTGGGWGDVLGGGAIAGGVCAIIGIGISVLLGEVPASLLALGTLSSAVTGAGGAGIARVVTRR
jgi:hypothetical protein